MGVAVGGVIFSLGLKEGSIWATVIGGIVVGFGFMGRLLPDFRYRHIKFSYKKATTIKRVLGTCITNRKQMNSVWLCMILTIIGGLLANEYIQNADFPRYRWLDSAYDVMCMFGLWVFLVFLLTGGLIYAFRDNNAKAG